MTAARGSIAREERRAMVKETIGFLDWALSHPDFSVRIPRRRVGTGRFSTKMKRAFWSHALSEIARQLRKLAVDKHF